MKFIIKNIQFNKFLIIFYFFNLLCFFELFKEINFIEQLKIQVFKLYIFLYSKDKINTKIRIDFKFLFI